jgi:uncharacterized membrane protein
MTALALALLAFVGTHFLMSHPLRAGMVARLGERAFQGGYSLISLVTFGLAIWAYRGIGDQAPLWTASDALWIAAALLMWIGSILFVGSFSGNPALPGAPRVARPQGVLGITRHPMMWSFAIWAVVHAAVMATPKALLLDGAIAFLALAGALGQDRKKQRMHGDKWMAWVDQTHFVPFGRGFANPGPKALIGGTLLFLFATWLHPMGAGLWR